MDITKNISNLIASQFPNIYRESGEELVAFLEAYYEFLEQTDGYSEYMNRRMFDANDIDRTLDKFIIHFKNKYLSEFPYATFVDKRFLVKHISDFYNTKGSAKSVRLLMKILFGEEADIYYPAKDILKPSDSKWVIPSYIELESSDRAQTYLGKKIIGSKSKATAFVEGIVRKRAQGKLIDVMYISNLSKEFVAGDYLTDDGNLSGAPLVMGSLRQLSVINGGVNYAIGDVVNVNSNNGSQGSAVVTSVSNPNDRVDLRLLDGGYGYTLDSDTEVYISDVKLRIVEGTTALNTFDQVYQYVFTANYSAATLVPYIGETITIRNSSNATLGSGTLLAATTNTVNIQWDGTTAIPTATINNIVTTGGATVITSIVNTTVEAFVVGVEGQGVGVYYTNAFEFAIPNVSGGTGQMRLGLTGATYTISYIEAGSGFVFDVLEITDTKSVSYNTDFVSSYLAVSLASSDYGFPASGSEILTTSLDTALTVKTATIGEISRIGNLNPGTAYESDPSVLIVNKYLSVANILDVTISLELSDIFPIRVGDLVKKADGGGYTESIAKVKSVTYPDAGYARVLLRIISTTIAMSPTETIYFFDPSQSVPKGNGIVSTVTRSFDEQPLGKNAHTTARVQSAVGSIETLRVNNSGFGYVDDEELILLNANTDSSSSIATATAIALNGGMGAGYWETTTSHLNSEKKIRDNFYYQEYSYEIQSGLALQRFSDIIKNTVHVAGTELFGKVINKSVSDVNTEVVETQIELI